MANEHATSALVIDLPRPFFSQKDEDQFFASLQLIPAVNKVTGRGRGVELIVKRPIDKESLYDLTALLTRYGLDRRPLKLLCDEQNDEYFCDEGKYWHSAIYG